MEPDVGEAFAIIAVGSAGVDVVRTGAILDARDTRVGGSVSSVSVSAYYVAVLRDIAEHWRVPVSIVQVAAYVSPWSWECAGYRGCWRHGQSRQHEETETFPHFRNRTLVNRFFRGYQEVEEVFCESEGREGEGGRSVNASSRAFVCSNSCSLRCKECRSSIDMVTPRRHNLPC